ncbi:thioesterase family protein [Aquibium sp. A9E412]|uniref:thioesterase family protein n=1 Tax=Aquibium sp. A9E412 TaxID=2976767 RepID=UPI0025B1769E|nr:thioesterase family protein [Aquibium sp. A9E412]MDN2567523.1 thioesterase family protein [Aquibium sp. A9E412]
MPDAAPFVSSAMSVEPAWIDYNGHLNMAYYNVLFDRCSDEAFEVLGMGPDYARGRKLTIYTAEIHVCYLRELHEGDRVTCTFHLVDHDAKRLHVYQELRHTDGWTAATAEVLSLHIDMAGPRVAPFPPDVMQRVEAMAAAHSGLERPARTGRAIGIARKAA